MCLETPITFSSPSCVKAADIKVVKLSAGVCNLTPGVVGHCKAWKYAWTFSVSVQNTHNNKSTSETQLYSENFNTYITLSGADRLLPIFIWRLWHKWQQLLLQSTVCRHMPAICQRLSNGGSWRGLSKCQCQRQCRRQCQWQWQCQCQCKCNCECQCQCRSYRW